MSENNQKFQKITEIFDLNVREKNTLCLYCKAWNLIILSLSLSLHRGHLRQAWVVTLTSFNCF